MNEEAVGIVPYGPGFAVRVAVENKEKLARQLLGESAGKVLGTQYVVSGLPLSWGKSEVTMFLGSWTAAPQFSRRTGFTRQWVVRSAEQPVATKLQHEFGLATINEYRPPAKTPQGVMRWSTNQKQNHSNVRPQIRAPAEPQGAWGPSRTAAASAAAAPQLPDASRPTAGANVAALPNDFIAQFQQMLTQALRPMQQTLERHASELTAMKRVVEQDLEDLEEAMEEEEDDDEEKQSELRSNERQREQHLLLHGEVQPMQPRDCQRPPEPASPPKTSRVGPY